MDINALLKKYEEELYYQSQVSENVSTQTASALMRLAVKEVAANADEGWKEATRLSACLAEAQGSGPERERVRQLEDELAHARQSRQKDAAALSLALLNVERLEEEARELRADLAAKDSYVAGLEERFADADRVSLLERENKQLHQAVENAVLLQRLYHQRWVDIREWAKKEEVSGG